MAKCYYCSAQAEGPNPEDQGWVGMTLINTDKNIGWMCPRDAVRTYQRDAQFYKEWYREEKERNNAIFKLLHQCNIIIAVTMITFALAFTILTAILAK